MAAFPVRAQRMLDQVMKALPPNPTARSCCHAGSSRARSLSGNGEASKTATVHLEDVSPVDIVGPDGAIALPTKTAFQTDLILIHVRARAAWAVTPGGGAGHQQRQLVSVMSDKYRETDWSGWNNWCDSWVDARRSFDRAVPIGLVAELKAIDRGSR
jgi:hypothetical protein